MKKTRTFLSMVLMLVLILLPMTVAAVFYFKTLDSRNKLNSSQINCILKDSRGYVWFGTPAGLYRYDGYTFKNFQSDSQDGSSLPDSYITGIQEALDGNLWVETASGICIYHPQAESFERDMNRCIRRWASTRHRNWCISNKGKTCGCIFLRGVSWHTTHSNS